MLSSRHSAFARTRWHRARPRHCQASRPGLRRQCNCHESANEREHFYRTTSCYLGTRQPISVSALRTRTGITPRWKRSVRIAATSFLISWKRKRCKACGRIRTAFLRSDRRQRLSNQGRPGPDTWHTYSTSSITALLFFLQTVKMCIGANKQCLFRNRR